jgi:hypothetical protein
MTTSIYTILNASGQLAILIRNVFVILLTDLLETLS